MRWLCGLATAQREVDASGDTLVRPSVAELLAAKDIGAGSDLDAKNARVERGTGRSELEQRRRRQT